MYLLVFFSECGEGGEREVGENTYLTRLRHTEVDFWRYGEEWNSVFCGLETLPCIVGNGLLRDGVVHDHFF
jgi:hypothetical protein